MNKSEIIDLLNLRGREQQELFQLARRARQEHFGSQTFIRAIIEPSNHCRNQCHYCAMRKSSTSVNRYRMTVEEILKASEPMIKNGIKVFSLETGEDPEVIDTIAKSASILKQKDCTLLGICGDLEKDDYKRLRDAGIDAYLLKFETSDPELFSRLRPGTTLKKRLKNIELLKQLRFNISTGNIIGLPGQTLESIANDVLLVQDLRPAIATVSPLIPSPGTPTEKESYGNIDLTLNTIAIYRLMMPEGHIPVLCAMNFYPGIGQIGALNAGANDVLINTAKPESLAYQFAIYSTDKKCVSLEDGLLAIKKAGLEFDPKKNCPHYGFK